MRREIWCEVGISNVPERHKQYIVARVIATKLQYVESFDTISKANEYSLLQMNGNGVVIHEEIEEEDYV